MAVVSTTTYQYVGLNLNPCFIQGSGLVDTGPWSSTMAYNVKDVVQSGVDQYTALAPNSGHPPTNIFNENWSALVVVKEQSGGVVDAGSDYYARTLAEQALQVGSSAYSRATEALVLAQTGTVLITAETGSRIAADAALTAFVFGSIAVDLAAETGSRIATDNYLLAQFGSINADTVIYGRNSLPTVGAALDSLFYVYPSVTSFTNSLNTVETGSTYSTVTLTWAYNKAVATQVINQGIGSLAYTLRTRVVNGTYNTTTTFTLTGSDGFNACNGNTTISFMQKRYWGVSALTSLNDAQVLALSNEFASSRAQTRTLSPSGQYVYFAYPASLGAATFTVNGLVNTDWILVTRALVNASGYSESYNIYRSTSLLTGTYVIAVS